MAATGDRLGRRTLNRALLERQLLLRRAELGVLEAVDHLVGVQAQEPDPPYYALWARISRFRPERLIDPLVAGEVVRIVVMRGTVHLIRAADALWLRPLMQPILDRHLSAKNEFTENLSGVDARKVAEVARSILDEEPLRSDVLGRRLTERWPDTPPRALLFAARIGLPLVQLPPRGVWGQSSLPVYATTDSWIGRELEPRPSAALMVRRYLAAFGPASVGDIRTWSGVTGLREVVEGIRPSLRTYVDERGRQLYDLPDVPLPDADTPAPVRFTAPFDNLVLSHEDRTRVMSEEHRKRLFRTMNGVFPGQVLVDGFVAGSWTIERKADRASVRVTAYRRLSKRHTASVEAEGRRLLRFAAPQVPAGSREVLFTDE